MSEVERKKAESTEYFRRVCEIFVGCRDCIRVNCSFGIDPLERMQECRRDWERDNVRNFQRRCVQILLSAKRRLRFGSGPLPSQAEVLRIWIFQTEFSNASLDERASICTLRASRLCKPRYYQSLIALARNQCWTINTFVFLICGIWDSLYRRWALRIFGGVPQ